MTRAVAFVIFPDFQLLDAAGPLAAFEIASAFAGGAYRLGVRAEREGLVRSSSGACWQARGLGSGRGLDTVLVAGGNGTRAAATSLPLRRWLCRLAARGVRLASVCSGSYLLAAAGLFDGKPATTHWSRTRDFRERFPRVMLEEDRIYVKAGRLWSSAGISAGIDLALAMIEEDLGEAVARRTARQLVVYHRRPGGQTQFSALLEMERTGSEFEPLLDAIRSNLRASWKVDALARRAGMSPRNFARRFPREAGTTPARAVERLRAEAARALLESGARSVQEVARETGFADPERMRRAFQRLYGVAPRGVRSR
jgi:transcriptional regulator GlxA family with amidase domain